MSKIKKGHPILGVVLGVLGIAAGLFLGILTGTLGGVIAGVLGALAIVLGILSRKGGRGAAAIVIGAIALITALLMGLVGNSIVPTLHENAVKYGEAPLVEKYSENNSFGFLGMLVRVTQDNVDMDAFTAELKAVTQQE